MDEMIEHAAFDSLRTRRIRNPTALIEEASCLPRVWQ
jgi:hypothetical protein